MQPILVGTIFSGDSVKYFPVDNPSPLSPNQDQKKYRQDEAGNDWGKRGFKQGEGQGSSGSDYEPREQGVTSEGYQEDQPGKPVRGTGFNSRRSGERRNPTWR